MAVTNEDYRNYKGYRKISPHMTLNQCRPAQSNIMTNFILWQPVALFYAHISILNDAPQATLWKTESSYKDMKWLTGLFQKVSIPFPEKS